MDTRNWYNRRAVWVTGTLAALVVGLAGCGGSSSGGGSAGGMGGGQSAARGEQPTASAVASAAGMADDANCDKMLQVTFTEKQAMGVATRWMRRNAYECFDLEGTRAAIRAAMR